jgi:polyketide synthase PksN
MDIAIIGLSCKLPGAENQFEFWENLVGEKSCIAEIPESRWDWKKLWGDPKEQINKTNSRWGGFVADPDAFDHEFFGLLPKVVEAMDPQQRMMLELTWRCLEDAGVAPDSVRGQKIGMMISVFNHDYKELQEQAGFAIEAHHSTGSAAAIIANRISHYFDFKGPSLSIDTACSGSLNAIHCAAQALEFGDCEMAIAGGINLILTPTRHISFSKMGMMSPTGSCRTFDESANGYVRGEGAGLLLLKPLDLALADGNTIYGVLKGSAVNHCGETYTLTYPSPESQANVIVAAHRRAGVSIDTVSYVEAHGTGTPKGDPIEFQGLQQAFATLASDQGIELKPGSCGLGSVKTNIGHLEAAAGVAGVIKVLMQFRFRQLSAIQHFEKLNPRINLENSPFYIQDKHQDWQNPNGKTPLRAGVSSFGFGGTNAHVVLEQAPVRALPPSSNSARKLIAYPVMLSAKSAEALRYRATDLLQWVEQHETGVSLLDLSFTLCTGRQHLGFRRAWLVESFAQLRECLQQILSESIQPITKDPASAQVQKLLQEMNQAKKFTPTKLREALEILVQAFESGMQFDWAPVFKNKQVCSLNLPGYRFAKTRFWLSPTMADPAAEQEPSLHPLLHKNVSSFDSQAFSSRFDGKEFFFADHRVAGQPVLPGAAYLEMVNKAIRESAAVGAEGTDIVIRDVTWLRPLIHSGTPLEVSTALYPLVSSVDDPRRHTELRVELEVEFEICSVASNGARLVHCQGVAALVPAHPRDTVRAQDTARAAQFHELQNLSVVENSATEIEHATFYRWMDAAGLNYGETHRCVRKAWLLGDKLLVKLTRGDAQDIADQEVFGIHPALLDAAIQAGVALGWSLDSVLLSGSVPEAAAARLPFLMDSMVVTGPLAGECLALVALESVNGVLHKISIDFANLDSTGAITGFPVGIRNLSLKGDADTLRSAVGVAPDSGAAEVTQEEYHALLSSDNEQGYYTPQWRSVPLVFEKTHDALALLVLADQCDEAEALDWISVLRARGHTVTGLITGQTSELSFDGVVRIRSAMETDADAFVQQLKQRQQPVNAILHLVPSRGHNSLGDPETLVQSLDSGIKTIFPLTRALMRHAKKLRFVSLVAGHCFQRPEHLGLSGFYKTLHIEKPSFSGRVIQFDNTVDAARNCTWLENEFSAADPYSDIAYIDDTRYVRQFADCRTALAQGIDHQQWLNFDGILSAKGSAFVAGGVYLITGGMGTLGLIFARHLLDRYSARIFLTGRGALDDARQKILAELNQGSEKVTYLQCDVGVFADVERCVAEIRRQEGRIQGVLHAAGVIEDDFIIKKSCASFARVLAPKSLGTVNLDLATAQDSLDCFILFSSVTGALGNLGQCDYGFGNAFEDYFSLYRNHLVARGERRGRALSVNWPYWRQGGMELTEKEEEILQRNFGIVPLETEAGIEALETALRLPLAQVAVLPGNAAKVRQVLGCIEPVNEIPPVHTADFGVSATDADILRNSVIDYLMDLFSTELKVGRERFTLTGSFQEFGFDSVVMLDLVNALEKRFAGLPKTLFFEHQSIAELAEFLLQNYGAELQRSSVQNSGTATAAEPGAAPNGRSRRQRAKFYSDTPTATRRDNRIAIIGIAGRYPEANDLDSFWKNLCAGRDCVREIPADRWDLDKMFQPGAAQQGKSYSKWGGFLQGVDQFDALFFNISPKEAEKLDPQERLFLETVAHAIEDAGYHPAQLAPRHGLQENPVGVYVGIMWGDYQLHGIESDNSADWVTPHSFYWSVANRVSYFFNFSGPSIALDTACSSSLTAIHLACNALINDEIKVAVAGGVNLSLHANKYNLLSDMHFLSSDGRCRSFGQGGDGYVPAEGVGAVLLKPLADAERDGDHIYGVIRSTAVNHGGKTSGFTVPNPNRQGSLIQDAIAKAGISAREISYVEAHGTGTSLGDPIEISGLTQAFKTEEKQFCALGSAKSNIGHAEAAAGIAGLTKVLLQMKHQTLVPSIHADPLNPYLEMEKTAFQINRELRHWPRPRTADAMGGSRELPRIAGISSFGAGGSNGHILVEEYVPSNEPAGPTGPVIIPLSARKQQALLEMAQNLGDFLQENPGLDIQRLACTLQTGRVEFEWRLALVVDSLDRCCQLLDEFIRGESTAHIFASQGAVRASGRIRTDVSTGMNQDTLASLAADWVRGGQIAWRNFYAQIKPARLSLPVYPYQRQRYWINKPESGKSLRGLHPVLQENISRVDAIEFRTVFSSHAFYLQDHQINGHRVLPGVVYLEMAWQAICNALPGHRILGLYDVEWLKPLVVDQGSAALNIRISPASMGYVFEILQADKSQVFCRGACATLPDRLPSGDTNVKSAVVDSALVEKIQHQLGIHALLEKKIPIAELRARALPLQTPQLDDRFATMGFYFGERFKPFLQVHCNEHEAIAEIRVPETVRTSCAQFVLNPVLLDAALRTSLAIGGHGPTIQGEVPLPVRLARLQLVRPLEEQVFVYAARQPASGDIAAREIYDIYLLNAAGEVLAFLESFSTHKVRDFLSHLPASADASRVAQPELTTAANQIATATKSPLAIEMKLASADSARSAALHFLKLILAEQTHLDYRQFDAAESASTYGVDSVMIHTINKKLAEVFGAEVSKTLFYEFGAIAEIAAHLAETFPAACDQLAATYVSENVGPGVGPIVPRVEITTPRVEIAAAQTVVADTAIETAIQNFIRRQIAAATQLPESAISVTEPFEHFGIDSVMIHKLNEKFTEVFGQDISKTLFYEYNDLAGLSEYFISHHLPQARANLPMVSAVAMSPDIVEKAPDRAGVQASLVNYLETCVRARNTASAALPIAEYTRLSFAQLQLDEVDIVHLVHRWRRDLGLDAGNLFYFAVNIQELAHELLVQAGHPDTLQARLDALHRPTAKPAVEADSSIRARAVSSVHPHREILQRLLATAGVSNQNADLSVRDRIAIIGLSGRYPLADDLDEFWKNLAEGRDCIREIPADRWDHGKIFDPDRNAKGKVYAKWGGFMDGVDQFDAELFKMTRREAEIVDPQERLFLQTAWQCLEDAAYTKSSLADSSVGVFVGVMWGHYELIDVSDEQAKLGRPAASFSSIANRVSYYFDFHGPSLALDSMCSSSLSAIHIACQSLMSGDCEYAIAGGVNVASHPTKYQLLSQQQFLSSDGRCRAFGEGGDGYVPGEGVGAVLLKPLQRALADGDHIYAVIHGSAVNHGGKTSGFTVPNQMMQSQVIGKALAQSGWPANTIQYVEAHGTGTSLGDPIELSGLTKAYSRSGAIAETSHRYLGSVKSNIGHLESAAGIAGLTKILLQMKHAKIVPSLHSQTLNPNLAIANSGFAIPQSLLDWPRPVDSSGLKQPRRAGVSSFGAGGSNAHLLIEEFIAADATAQDKRPGLFILSSDSHERLRLYVERVLSRLAQLAKGESANRNYFHDLCYTSMVGREIKAHRVAVVCDNALELGRQLQAWLESKTPAGLYSGEVKNKTAQLDALFDEKTRETVLETLFKSDRLHQLAGLWVAALDINWRQHLQYLYPRHSTTRVSLPSQPLVTERYWVESKVANPGNVISGPHPLLDSNDSTIARQVFSKRFSGEEFYLRDHRVENSGSQVILPGVAYLEMARAAAQLSVPEDYQVRKIRNVMWLRPLQIQGAPQNVSLLLSAHGIGMEYSVQDAADANTCFSSGEVVFSQSRSLPQPERLDIDALRTQNGVLEANAEIYHLYQQMGFYYGPAYQVTQWRLRMRNAALAKLQLPQNLRAGAQDFVLHPSLMDGALRTCLGIGDANYVAPMVPFSLGEIEIFGPLQSECYVYATRAQEKIVASGTDASVQTATYHLVITDMDGHILVKVKDIGARALVKNAIKGGPQQNYFNYQWRSVQAAAVSAAAPGALLVLTDSIAQAQRYRESYQPLPVVAVVPAELNRRIDDTTFNLDLAQDQSLHWLFEQLTARSFTPALIINDLQYDPFAPAERNLQFSLVLAYHLFRGIQKFCNSETIRYLEVCRPQDQEYTNPFKSAISGFANSMIANNHHFAAACVTLRHNHDGFLDPELARKLWSRADFNGREFRYDGDTRTLSERRLCALQLPAAPRERFAQSAGTVLITGGLGRLGLALATNLAEFGRGNIALVSRRAPDPGQWLEIAKLQRVMSGKNAARKIVHLCADVADAQSVQQLFTECKARFGSMDTIVHAAGSATATSILDADLALYCESLQPKIFGLLNLLAAADQHGVGTLVAFSSVSVALGDLGTGSYAAANRFMDAMAENQRSARTRILSINWPFWATGGMQIPEAEMAALRFSGLVPMPENIGMEALANVIAADDSQIFVAYGNSERIAGKLNAIASLSTPILPTTLVAAPQPSEILPALSGFPIRSVLMDQDNLLSKIREFVCTCVAQTTRLEMQKIHPEKSFESFGMDSVLLMELQKKIADAVPGLSKTILFEYDCVENLSEYLYTQKRREIGVKLGWQEAAVADNIAVVNGVEPVSHGNIVSDLLGASLQFQGDDTGCVSIAHLFTKSALQEIAKPQPGNATDVAVIGMAGRFPQAENLEVFWQKVLTGSNCVTEIPETRWAQSTGVRESRPSYLEALDRKWGGFIEDVHCFDYRFFGMTKIDAAKMDPQLRLLLETAWHALEDAAYRPEQIRHQRVGVFVGAMNNDHSHVTEDLLVHHNTYFGPGAVDSELANRISYVFDVRGPSLTVKTACSSSLTALHLACSAIKSGDCDMAIVGGVNLSLHPHKYLMLQDMKVLSNSASEKTFDQNADGLIPSEGVGVVILKQAERALQDRDNIHGLIKATSLSHSGVGAGQFIPNLKVLEATMQDCLEKSGIDVQRLEYVESHGTATALGDPIELRALENLAVKNRLSQLIIGTKANLGHMEAASGICALLKVLCSFRYGRIAPCANLKKISDTVTHGSPLVFPRESMAWRNSAAGQQFAGIHSFGMGGANAFAIVQSPMMKPATDVGAGPAPMPLLLLSAVSGQQLRALVKQTYQSLESQTGFPPLVEICYSSQVGRTHHNVRLAVVVKNIAQLLQVFRQFIDGEVAQDAITGDLETSNLGTLMQRLATEQAVQQLQAAGHWRDLADLWVRGVKLDWEKFYGAIKPWRVSLPGYVFAKLECSLDSMVEEIKDIERKKRLNFSLVTRKNYPSGDDFTMESQDWFRVRCVKSVIDAEYGALLDETIDEHKKRRIYHHYWEQYLADAGGKPALMANVEGAREFSGTAGVTAEIRPEIRVEQKIDAELLHDLKKYSRNNRIELDTLGVAAWSVLMSRIAKSTQSLFPIKRRLSTPFTEQNTSRYEVFPLLINTMVRGKCDDWLLGLQARMNKKHIFASAAALDTTPLGFLTLLGLQNHFDAQLVFHGADADGEHLEQGVARTIVCVGEKDGGLVLNLKSDPGSLSTTIAVRVLQDFAEVLTRLPEFADKNPAAIPVGNSRKKRLDVIQRIEEAR